MAKERQSIKVVFLDIDGVILPFNETSKPGNLFPDRTLDALSLILDHDHSGEIKLVLSSTWRVQASFRQQILDDFHRYTAAEDGDEKRRGGPLEEIAENGFFGVTDPALHSERQHEIADWLQTYRLRNKYLEVIGWVALDDEELIHGEENKKNSDLFQGRVVKTDSHKGLTLCDAKAAIEILQLQESSQKRLNTKLRELTD